MPVSTNCWLRQLFESMREASVLYERFKNAQEPDVDDLDKAGAIHKECSNAYEEIKSLCFEYFIEFGNSLRARQASL